MELNIVGPETKDYLEVFQVLFVDKVSDTVLPELLDIFGHDALLKFLDIFCGTTIKIPDRDVLKTVLRNTEIYTSMKRGNTDIKYLARKHNINEHTIREIYSQVKETLSKYGKKIVG
jgi:Mor family transcriptional regulator